MDERTRRLLMVVRQALIMVLGALEDYLGMPRSIVPQRNGYAAFFVGGAHDGDDQH